MHQQKQGIVWSCAMGAGNFESGNVTELYRVADGTDIRKTVVLTGVTFSPQEDVPPLSVVDVDVGAFGNVELSHKMRFADLELRGFHGMYGGQSDVRPLRVAGLISVRDFEGIAGELTIDRVVLRAANGPQAVGGIVRAKKSFVTVSDSIVYGASAVYGGVFFAHDEAMIDVSGPRSRWSGSCCRVCGVLDWRSACDDDECRGCWCGGELWMHCCGGDGGWGWGGRHCACGCGDGGSVLHAGRRGCGVCGGGRRF